MCEPSGSCDAAHCCGGGVNRSEDMSTGSGVPTHTPDPARSAGCSPRRRQTDLLADESAPSAAAARGLHKDRLRPMTAESRLPSMHTQWTAGQTGRGMKTSTSWEGCNHLLLPKPQIGELRLLRYSKLEL